MSLDSFIDGIIKEEIDKKSKKMANLTYKKIKEELKGNQDQIDANKNGRIDKMDFAILRNKKKHKKISSRKKKTEEGITEAGVLKIRDLYENHGSRHAAMHLMDYCLSKNNISLNEMADSSMYDKALNVIKAMVESRKFRDAFLEAKEFAQRVVIYENEIKIEHETLNEAKKKKNRKSADGIPDGEEWDIWRVVPLNFLKDKKKKMEAKTKKGEKLSADDKKLLQMIDTSLKSRKVNENVVMSLKESELIDLIEELVTEEKLDKKVPAGLRAAHKAQKESKKSNEKHIADIGKKMTKYVGKKYKTNPDTFPERNGGDRKGYNASEAVDEYVENFGYGGGMSDLHYDEIEPNKKWIKDTMTGSSKTGNNPEWGNAVKTDVNDRIHKRSGENSLFSAEKKRTYNKSSQPIDFSGGDKKKGKLKNMFSQLESKDNVSDVISEEINHMKSLISYNKITQ